MDEKVGDSVDEKTGLPVRSLYGETRKPTPEQLKDLDARLEGLWHQHRAERARIRFGEREEIVRRARAEERLERAA